MTRAAYCAPPFARQERHFRVCVPKAVSQQDGECPVRLDEWAVTRASDTTQLVRPEFVLQGGKVDEADVEADYSCQTVLLEPGDILFMTRGVVHNAFPTEQGPPSVHVTISKVSFISYNPRTRTSVVYLSPRTLPGTNQSPTRPRLPRPW